MDDSKTVRTVASGLTLLCRFARNVSKNDNVISYNHCKFKVWNYFKNLDFIHLKINNRTVPNKKVRMGKSPKINNCTAYDYLNPQSSRSPNILSKSTFNALVRAVKDYF